MAVAGGKTARVICMVLVELIVFGGIAGAFVSWGSALELDLYSGRLRESTYISLFRTGSVDRQSDLAEAYRKLIGDYPKEEQWVPLVPSTTFCYGLEHIRDGVKYHFVVPEIYAIGQLSNGNTSGYSNIPFSEVRLTDAAKKKLLLGLLSIMRESTSDKSVKDYYSAVYSNLTDANWVGDESAIPDTAAFIHQD